MFGCVLGSHIRDILDSGLGVHSWRALGCNVVLGTTNLDLLEAKQMHQHPCVADPGGCANLGAPRRRVVGPTAPPSGGMFECSVRPRPLLPLSPPVRSKAVKSKGVSA